MPKLGHDPCRLAESKYRASLLDCRELESQVKTGTASSSYLAAAAAAMPGPFLRAAAT
jgi:hypothetical protein